MRLWYTSPPAEYISGLPVGTGRLAAMVMGYPAKKRVALNHEWLWRGVNRDGSLRVPRSLVPDYNRRMGAVHTGWSRSWVSCLYAAGKFAVKDGPGRSVRTRHDGHRLRFKVRAGRTYRLTSAAPSRRP